MEKRRVLRVLVAAGALGLGVSGCPEESRGLVVSGRIEIDRVHVGSKLGGRVSRVAYEEGDRVAAGVAIVLLERQEFEASLAQALAGQAEAQAQLDLLLAGARAEDIRRAQAVVAARRSELALRRKGFRPEEVREARAQLVSARSRLELAKREFSRTENLKKTGVIDAQRLDAARSAFETSRAGVDIASERLQLMESGSRPEEIAMAEAGLAEAEATLERLRNGPRPEEIAAARAGVEATKARAEGIRTQLAETEIRAPRDCSVETLDLHPGDLVKAGQSVATLELRRNPWVRCYVPENRLGWVRPGMEVTVTVDSLPDHTFPGRVRKVNSQAEFTPRNVQTSEKRAELVFEMKVDITTASELLRAGMYADVHVPEGGRS